ncbi:aldo/keto reductase [Pseudomonas kuykendallii]|uniref:Aldo/keto reductase n=1 Tax=Pseudomonas kuykendallii TaxID=1007099 RepID=A0A2W5D127_9PSED|nr:aldo/keto reductase [Pseudomonas kuykendallii]PZP22140.1 MAG: aldo/keto reductase [Pseudomonas kuykendallii]
MPTRRQFVQQSSLLAAMAGLAPLLPASAFAADGLLMRSIPSSGERLPVIGLGTSRTFNVDPGSGEMAELLEVMKAFVAGGARLIDTAPSYGDAEAVSGELVKRVGARDKVFLATKVSSTGREAGQRQIEASFKALQTDRIDLIQVHNLQDTTTQLGLLRELKEQGRIRYVGITHYVESAHDDLIAVLQKEKVDFVQFNYSVAARNAEKRLLPFCAAHGIATLINRTYGAGQLFARVKGKALPGWAVAELDASSWAQLMLKFVLADPAVTAVIPATSNPRYMADNLLAGQGRLPDARQREQIAAEFA